MRSQSTLRFAHLCVLGAFATATGAQSSASDALDFRAVYQQIVEINSSHSGGGTTKVAALVRDRLLAAGFGTDEVTLMEPFPGKGNLLARFKGNGHKRPMLLLAHIDVVEAKRDDWKTDPFKLEERDGVFTARGSIDDKAMAASYVSVLTQLKREGFVPNRDIVLALTADEERGDVPSNGANWLLKEHRDVVDAEFGINEGGRGELKNGKPFVHVMQVGEKTYLEYEMEATGLGGHSARPTPDNTIYDLAEALVRLRRYRFPVQLNDAARTYFQRVAPQQQDPELRADFLAVAGGQPSAEVIERLSNRSNIIGLLRTTCVATMVKAGHAPNALAQSATATINCRGLPDQDLDFVTAKLVEIAGPKVKVKQTEHETPAPSSPLHPDIMRAAERITAEMWPGVPLVPTMGVSSTDSRSFRAAGIPMYGVSGLFVDPENTGVHGLNEHIGVRQLNDGREFMFRMIKALATD
jgi:acetylornithine deacetylase/succinyl-diaminopimelate desuccinylase-like protein